MIKLKCFCTVKETINNANKKILFLKMWPVRVNLLKIQTFHAAQLKKNPIKKWAEDLNIFLQRHRCLKGIWKDTQNHYCVLFCHFSHVWLSVTLWTLVHQAPLQARILEWVAIFFSRGSSQPRDQTHISGFCNNL